MEAIKYARKCSECGCGMNEGFVVAQGDFYYCSKECLDKRFTPEEWFNECMEYNPDRDEYEVGDWSYYTEWDIEDDSEMEWVEVEGKLIPNSDY